MLLFFRLTNFLTLSFNFFPVLSIVGSKVRLKCAIFLLKMAHCRVSGDLRADSV